MYSNFTEREINQVVNQTIEREELFDDFESDFDLESLEMDFELE